MSHELALHYMIPITCDMSHALGLHYTLMLVSIKMQHSILIQKMTAYTTDSLKTGDMHHSCLNVFAYSTISCYFFI